MNERTISYQGLRLLFFVSIVAGHCGHTICGGGGELCSFFFIISGFLYKYRAKYWDYMMKKVLGIFPIYYICLAVTILGHAYKGHLHLGLDIFPHLFLLQSWIPSVDGSPSSFYVGPAWFISSLLFCYAISPICYNTIRYIGKGGGIC